ncbi:MAG: PASTA domain-containing protein, partial [Bacillota bacterium]|nr:PASTA domain-containing protein [Bacillota bacterium]
TTTCSMHEGGFYDRPPFIITDHRWSGRGGAGRGPEDAGELPSSEGAFGGFGSFGQDPATSQVPNVRGLSLSAAEARLARANLRVGTIRKQYSNDVPENIVIGQSPAPGMIVFKNQEILLLVSQGPR